MLTACTEMVSNKSSWMLLILYSLLDQVGAYSVQIVQVLPGLGRFQDNNPAVCMCYSCWFSGEAFGLLAFGFMSTQVELSHSIFPIVRTLKQPVSSSYPQNWSVWLLSKSFLLCSSFGWKNAWLNSLPPTYVKVLLLWWSFLPTEEKLKLFYLPHQNSDSDDKHRENLDVFIAGMLCLNSTFNKSWHCKF